MMWVVLLGCGGSASDGGPLTGPFGWLRDWWTGQSACDEPHLFYAPDGSGDVYFGCVPPAGWLETPPEEVQYGPPPLVDPDVAAVRGETDLDSGLPIYVGTAVTADTAGAAPIAAASPDTGLPAVEGDTWDTGAALASDTAPIDTAVLSDTGIVDTGAAPAADTGLPPLDTAAPPTREQEEP